MGNKGFLFGASSWKIKSHVVESQIALLVCPCLNHLQKNIAQLIRWSFLIIQSVSFTSAAFEAFAEAYLCFLVSASAKKNAEVMKFLGILKKYVSENKMFFVNKKVIFVFHTIFKLDFIMQIIYCIIHRCLCSHFTFFCSLLSVSKKWSIETMLTFPYSYNWRKFNNHKKNEKRNQAYQSMDPEYETGQINSYILELL